MEDGEGGEAEEDVDNVGGELYALLPVLLQHTSKGQEERLWRQYTHTYAHCNCPVQQVRWEKVEA